MTHTDRHSHAAPTPVSRRHFLRTGSLLTGAAAVGLAGSPTAAGVGGQSPDAPRPSPLPDRRGGATNLIFMVADGMSTGTLTLADVYSRRILGRPSHWVALMNQPGVRRACATTHSADSIVTDSAAGASAWGIGVKVNNDAVNITPAGDAPDPLLVRARAAGRAIGLVTTRRLTDATPAGFIANVPARKLEVDIARQMLDRGIDFALGGGASKFAQPLLDSRPGLRTVRTRAELSAAIDAGAGHPGAPLLGLFTPEHMNLDIDRAAAGAASTEPTLAEMTTAALSALAAHPGGFAVQIEGGQVDHAAHINDAAALLHDQLAFDAAVDIAARFAASRDDTLLVITTDHGNANPGLTFSGPKGFGGFETLTRAKHSFDWLATQLAALTTPAARDAAVIDLVNEMSGIALRPEEAATLRRALKREPVEPFAPANQLSSVLGSLLANHTGVSFMSPDHTADLVEVTAMGPGSEHLAAAIDNTDLHHLAVEALSLATPR